MSLRPAKQGSNCNFCSVLATCQDLAILRWDLLGFVTRCSVLLGFASGVGLWWVRGIIDSRKAPPKKDFHRKGIRKEICSTTYHTMYFLFGNFAEETEAID